MTTYPQDTIIPSSRDVLAARGCPIILMDGSTVRLRYSMASLRELEARFGSLKGISIEINAAKRAMDDPSESIDASSSDPSSLPTTAASAPLFSILSDALRAGLLHERRVDQYTGERYRLGADAERCDELLDPGQLQSYMEAFAAALQQAFGDLAGEAGRTAVEAAQRLSSPGASGTTSAPSSADAPTGSFGG